MVGEAETVKNSGRDIGLNFLSGVPLESFVGKDSLTRKPLETWTTNEVTEDFVKNFTIELASARKPGLGSL